MGSTYASFLRLAAAVVGWPANNIPGYPTDSHIAVVVFAKIYLDIVGGGIGERRREVGVVASVIEALVESTFVMVVAKLIFVWSLGE